MRTCGICGCDKITKTYEGLIRDGGLGKYTNDPVVMWRCTGCDAIWHDPILKTSEYYQSEEYRLSLEDTANPKDFYKLHDKESKWKFDITGTDIFRDKVVIDVGCGMGGVFGLYPGVGSKGYCNRTLNVV